MERLHTWHSLQPCKNHHHLQLLPSYPSPILLRERETESFQCIKTQQAQHHATYKVSSSLHMSTTLSHGADSQCSLTQCCIQFLK